MQTTDSLRFGLKFAGSLGSIEKRLIADEVEEIQKSADVVVDEVEKAEGNPWRDEAGKFTDEANAVFNVNAALHPAELEARAKDYEKLSQGEKAAGKKPGFRNYIPKDAMPANASPKWKELNTGIGKFEGVANAYMTRYRTMGEAHATEGKEQKAYWLANAGALRDMARIMAEKRDKLGAKAAKLAKPADRTSGLAQAAQKVPKPAAAKPEPAVDTDHPKPQNAISAPENFARLPHDKQRAALVDMTHADQLKARGAAAGVPKVYIDQIIRGMQKSPIKPIDGRIIPTQQEIVAAGDHFGLKPIEQHDQMRAVNEADRKEKDPAGHIPRMIRMANAITDPAKAFRRAGAMNREVGTAAAFIFYSRAALLLGAGHKAKAYDPIMEFKEDLDFMMSELRLEKEGTGIPDFISEAFGDLEAVSGPEGEDGIDAATMTRMKKMIVNNAVMVGLISQEEANEITAGL
jgi:hypothetical protein